MAGETRRGGVRIAAVAAFALIAQQVAGKATRDALFLSQFDATSLPLVMIASAAVALVSVLAVSRALARRGPARVVPIALFGSALLFVGEWALAPSAPRAVAWIVYLHMAAFGAIVISGFWSIVNERFDPHAAKKQVARIATGSTLGGVVGGVLAERMAVLVGVVNGLVVLAALHAIAGIAAARLGPTPHSARSAGEEARSGLQVLRETPYLQLLAALVTVIALSATLLDYVFKARAAEVVSSGESLLRFFAVYYTATAVLTFVVQSTMGRTALAKLGLPATIALLPAAVALSGAVAATAAQLWAAALAKAADTILSNSLFRSGYELLYTPLPRGQKRAAKTIVDVAFERLGDALGSGLVLVVLAVAAAWTPVVVTLLAVAASMVALWLTRRLATGYVDALARSLKDGAVELSSDDSLDATTRRTVTETTLAIHRDTLLEQIRILREKQASEAPPKTSSGDADSSPGDITAEPASSIRPPSKREGDADRIAEERAKFIQSARDLTSNDVDRIRKAISGPIDPRLVPMLLALLERQDVHGEVLERLRTVAADTTGQLVDALLDQKRPFTVRRRIPRALSVVTTDRAVEGLLSGLADPRFEVRYQCGLALSRILGDAPSLRVSTERAYEAVLRELDAGRKVWESQLGLDHDGDDSTPWLDGVVRARLHRSVEHVFTLLSLVLDRESLRLALRALESGDPALRGTALEYLENVLPDGVRRKLWPYLDVGPPVRAKARPREQIVEDLLKSMDSVPVDREALRKP